MPRKLNYDFLKCATFMPPLLHSTAKPFDITQSEVAGWLASQPEIMQKIFEMASRKGLIVFDENTGRWQGIYYDT